MKNQPYVTGKTVDSSNNLTVLGDRWKTFSVHVTATSSLAGVFEGTMDDVNEPTVTADWYPLAAIYENTSGVTENAPGATITPTDDDTMHAVVQGSRFVRFRRTAGSGTVSYSLHNQSIEEVRSAAGDVSTTVVTPPAVLLHTMICDTTNENLISASARKLWGVEAFSLDATPVYVKLYDKATAPSEADTPVYRSGVPANSTASLGAGRQAGPWPVYVALTNGLGIRVVTGLTDASDGALTADEVIVNVWYST